MSVMPPTQQNHNQTKNTRRTNHKSPGESAIIERIKANPKRIFDRKPQPQEKLHPKLLKSPPTPVKTNPKIRRQTLSGIKTEFARKFFNARSQIYKPIHVPVPNSLSFWERLLTQYQSDHRGTEKFELQSLCSKRDKDKKGKEY